MSTPRACRVRSGRSATRPPASASSEAASRAPVVEPRVDDVELRGRAHAVLEANRRGRWTCPSSTLYPHQWLWDSCFIAIGLVRTDPTRAAGELRSLFRGQWANGM